MEGPFCRRVVYGSANRHGIIRPARHGQIALPNRRQEFFQAHVLRSHRPADGSRI